ncbi:Short-chain dehydrogenase/reductase SDR [Penicillium nucicola]|uniref:Short-chain dehydrogenase/reductase SDR n=1 Tax=Penicillium nucicola TaxID=1850975 RepID=UPI0025459C1C|nr:Short-chain dehydrogenase/reductase SDR [Penicillium nucicola]KAJ5757558.1 Short-chain dehydrogenase/reductase SDR [Penicillium nucicola]
MPKIFLITGSSTGFGHDLVQEVLNRGDIAIATARNPASLEFENTTEKNYLPLELDVTSVESIKAAFAQAVKHFERIDVVVNNAGYGLSGCFEEYTDAQIRMQMEVNFFGLVNVTREAMATMRDQTPSGGVIQQVTSVGGQRGAATFSLYAASKWAVEGFTESIAKEVKPEWGIKFTCVEPGGFRTDWAGRSMTFTDRHPAYDHLDAKKTMMARHGTQPGDPKKAARAFYDLAVMDEPPLRVLLGSDAYPAILAKLEDQRKDFMKYEAISLSTDV